MARRSVEIVGWIAAACLLGLAAIFAWQDRLLYFPAAAPIERLVGGELQAWPSAQDFRGLVAAPPGPARGTAIVFHGNAGHAGHRAYYAQLLRPLGWRVILAEYPGYGPRAGQPGETNLVADAEEIVALAQRQYGGPLLLVGESLGAAVAAAAGARRRELVAGLILITPWDRLAHVGSFHYPWLPVRWMLRDGWDTGRRLAGFDHPVVIVVAEHDRIVPARFGTALHAALAGPKHLLVIAASDHNDWPDRVDAAWWARAVALALGQAP
jgi:pimeloyl-ACP methyl ester carboxylesterase